MYFPYYNKKIMVLTTLYKKYKNNKVKFWAIEIDRHRYRILSGSKESNTKNTTDTKVVGGWIRIEPFDEFGNPTNAIEDVKKKVNSLYKKKKRSGFKPIEEQ